MKQIFCFVTLLLLAPLTAASEEKKEEQLSGPVQVQLLSFVVPVKSVATSKNADSLVEMPITLVLDVADEKQGSLVCMRGPRIRDAVMESLYYRPIPMKKNKKLDVGKVESRLFKLVNKALRGPRIIALHVVPGAKPLRTGSGKSLASSLGCGVITD